MASSSAPLKLRGKSISTYAANEIATRLDDMEVGQTVDVVVDDSEVLDRELSSWATATGHGLRRGDVEAGGRAYTVTKGEPRATERSLAMVISNPGLFELLSPLGFALAAGLEGMPVRIYFQAQAVRVLARDFTPKIRGAARPFSRFARSGLERAGHVHPHEKLRQLRDRGAEFYVCGPSMEHFKVAKEDLIFPDITMCAYLTFIAVMADSDVHVFVQ
jgi:predicted peroxiredoxin/TusA-related sulfurtransferase